LNHLDLKAIRPEKLVVVLDEAERLLHDITFGPSRDRQDFAIFEWLVERAQVVIAIWTRTLESVPTTCWADTGGGRSP
jgi:hypothetical protein